MRDLKLIILPLLLILTFGAMPANASDHEKATLDQETVDRIRESYGLERPDSQLHIDPYDWTKVDWGMSTTSAFVHLVSPTIPSHFTFYIKLLLTYSLKVLSFAL